METKLLPCPKCNGTASLIEGSYDYDGGDRWYAFSAEVECLECGLLFKVHNDYPKKYVSYDAMWDFAIEAWNTRAERTVVLKANGRCPDCDKLVGEGERYCAYCGAKVVQDAD